MSVSSLPLTMSTAPPHAPTHNRRLRPLSLLVDSPLPRSSPAPTPTPSSDFSAPAVTPPLGSPTPTQAGKRRAGLKRVSSISYSPRSRPSTAPSSSTTPSSSTDVPDRPPSPSLFPFPSPSSSFSIPAPTPGPSQSSAAPLTLPEKHADLLHYIAQKEARVMDLRRQLTDAERELSGLKKKWEGIVARSAPPSGAAAATTTATGSGTKKVGEVLSAGQKLFSDLVFESLPPIPNPAPTRTSSKHVQMVPLSSSSSSCRPPPSSAGRPDSISSISSLSQSRSSEDNPRSPSPREEEEGRNVSELFDRMDLGGLGGAGGGGGAGKDGNALTAGPTFVALTQAVGKKWEEIKGSDAYTTTSKRASLLLSTFPASLAQSFAPSPKPSLTSPSPARRPPHLSTTPTPAHKRWSSMSPLSPVPPTPTTLSPYTPSLTTSASPSPSTTTSTSPSSTFPSLLDDPESDLSVEAPVLVPTQTPTPSPRPGTMMLVLERVKEGDGEEEEDAWGW